MEGDFVCSTIEEDSLRVTNETSYIKIELIIDDKSLNYVNLSEENAQRLADYLVALLKQNRLKRATYMLMN